MSWDNTAAESFFGALHKLGEFLVAKGVVDDIGHEGLRMLLSGEGVTLQRLKTWKPSTDPGYVVKKARVEHLYAIAGREPPPSPANQVDRVEPAGAVTGRVWSSAARSRRGRHKDASCSCSGRVPFHWLGLHLTLRLTTASP